MVRIFDKKLTAEGLTALLQAAYGENLAAVVLYGSAAAGDFFAGRSDQNILVVLKDASAAELKKSRASVRSWARQGNSLPLFFTPDGIARSVDVFPVEFLDFKDHHRVLAGVDPFAALAVDTKNLRLQIENELKGKLLKLRQAYFLTDGKPAALRHLMTDTVSSFLVLFRHALRLFGETPPARKTDSLVPLSMKITFDHGVFQEVLDMRAGHKKGNHAMEPLFERYLGAVQSVVEAVDKL